MRILKTATVVTFSVWALLAGGCSKSGTATSGDGGGGAGAGTGGSGGTAGGGGSFGIGGSSGGGGSTGSGGTGGGLAGRPTPKGDYTLGTPMNPDAWKGTPVTTGTPPEIVYPSDQTRFPRNIYRTLFQWKNQGYTQFRMSFAGAGTNVSVFTDGKNAGCAANAAAACWEADEESWFLISYGNAGKTATWTVDALDTSTQPATIRRGKPITMGFSRMDVEGAIFYWSTTSAGIRRANIAAKDPEDYITGKPSTAYNNPSDSVTCVACHVVSRDGKYLIAPTQAAAGGESLWVMEVTSAAPPTPLVKKIDNTADNGFATISPDNANVVAAWGGKMWMVDRATGVAKGDLPLGQLQGTHPDWSPDGSQLVFATASGDAPLGASLAVIPWSNGKWGVPKVIVQSPGVAGGGGKKGSGLTNLFPMHSPGSKLIAFSRGSKGGHGDGTTQLWMVPAAGGTEVELVNANRVVSNQMSDGQHENNQPTWAPPGDLYWVAFNSVREYGMVQGRGRQQIWVAAIDPGKASQGQDPSYPAFRLQFQGLNEDNHRAFWTLDVRDPPKTPPKPSFDGGMCVATGNKCDPTRDTCCDTYARCDTTDEINYSCEKILIP